MQTPCQLILKYVRKFFDIGKFMCSSRSQYKIAMMIQPNQCLSWGTYFTIYAPVYLYQLQTVQTTYYYVVCICFMQPL